jgi:hypothetical protein
MSDFLVNFLQFALTTTSAERGLVVDIQHAILHTIALDTKALSSKIFDDLMKQVVEESMTTQTAVLTNNAISDPLDAPKTNTSFSDLRVIVAIPIEGHGAVYLDRPIKFGVIGRDILDKLTKYAKQLVEQNHLTLTSEEMLAQFGAVK